MGPRNILILNLTSSYSFFLNFYLKNVIISKNLYMVFTRDAACQNFKASQSPESASLSILTNVPLTFMEAESQELT